MAQKPHVPTEADRNKVRIMASMGMTLPQMSAVMGISHVTLTKYYKNDIDHGAAIINQAITANLARQALKNDFKAAPAAMFWAKTRMGWRDTSNVEHSGPNGGAIQIISALPPKEPE